MRSPPPVPPLVVKDQLLLIEETPQILPPLGASTWTGFIEVSVLMIKYSRRVVTAGNVILTVPEAALPTTV